MYTIKQPKEIIFGMNSCQNFVFPKNSLLITSKGAKSRGWLDYLNLLDYHLFDSVEPNPSMNTIDKILSEFVLPKTGASNPSAYSGNIAVLNS